MVLGARHRRSARAAMLLVLAVGAWAAGSRALPRGTVDAPATARPRSSATASSSRHQHDPVAGLLARRENAARDIGSRVAAIGAALAAAALTFSFAPRAAARRRHLWSGERTYVRRRGPPALRLT